MYPIRTPSGVVLEHRSYIPNMILRNTIYNLLSQMRRQTGTNRVLNSEVYEFFRANWNYDLARELGIENFTIPAVIPDMPLTRHARSELEGWVVVIIAVLYGLYRLRDRMCGAIIFFFLSDQTRNEFIVNLLNL